MPKNITPPNTSTVKDDRVLTHVELEEQIASGEERVISSESLVMIQCVGCRQEDRNYCSRVCCSMP